MIRLPTRQRRDGELEKQFPSRPDEENQNSYREKMTQILPLCETNNKLIPYIIPHYNTISTYPKIFKSSRQISGNPHNPVTLLQTLFYHYPNSIYLQTQFQPNTNNFPDPPACPYQNEPGFRGKIAGLVRDIPILSIFQRSLKIATNSNRALPGHVTPGAKSK